MITRMCRETKTQITIGSANELALDDCEGTTNWYTICEKHGTAIGHQTKSMATMFAPVPKEWCEFCAGTQTWCDTHNATNEWCECHD